MAVRQGTSVTEMGKSRHYRPEERSIHLAKPVENKPTKYKRDLFKTEDEDEFECLDDWTDDDKDFE
jgi:hypothetical protein